MKRTTKYSLRLQYVLGWISVLFLAPLTFVVLKAMGYRIKDLNQLRAQVRAAMGEDRGGWIICANHLTMIDSVILAHAMMPLHHYVGHYRDMPWNLPERANFQKNIVLTILCYLTKCIPISRGGDRGKMKETMEKCVHLLNSGSNLLIFPEGGRTRTGRVDTDSFSYGVGRLAQKSDHCRILCVFLRGIGQEHYSAIPRRGETFMGEAVPFVPDAVAGGLKGQRELARQIVETLAAMEEEWFSRVKGLRHHRIPASAEKRRYGGRYRTEEAGFYKA